MTKSDAGSYAHGLVSAPRQPNRFDTTHWSLVQAAGEGESSEARAALATLCEIYWWPLYWFARRRGHDADQAQDLTQGFLTRLIEKGDARDARPDRGRFRSFLLSAFTHFIQNQAQFDRAQKRGGGVPPLPLEFDAAEDRYRREPSDARTPETAFDRRWALTLLDQAFQRLRREESDAGRAAEFDLIKPGLLGQSPAGGYEAWARTLGTTEGAVKVAVHRLRKRFQQALRDEVAHTVSLATDVDDELRYLMAALRR
jgi:RNA polymerase sigma-70 factor (ECF subfamily)